MPATNGAAIEVADATALGETLVRLLLAPDERARMVGKAREIVEQNRGALDRVLAIVARELNAARAV